MGKLRDFIEELDFFAHNQLLRYKEEPGYRTVTGGIVSIILVILFISIFANLVINTFQNNIIISQTSITYDTDPTYYQRTANPANKFMFAVGITGIDLSSAQRYFDIELDVFTVVNNVKQITKVNLSPCTLSQWSGISNEITSAYNSLKFGQWLCPPTGYVFPIQGKKTSDVFKYAKLTISKCGSVTNNSTCMDSTTVENFIINNQGATLNFYYVNTILNPTDNNYIDYYLQDSNYFSFDTNIGVSANLYYSEYSIQTDHSILPWGDSSKDYGALAAAPANSQIYSIVNTNVYAKFYMRKSSQRFDITRSFQKLDQTLSYIGGLLGFVLLLLTFMSIYSKFCYEIQFGDRIFKQNNNASYGSDDFNFIVYLGYGFYNILTMIGIYIDWKAMKKYHQCRIECLKQLDIELLFKKIEFLEDVSKIVLEDHHIKGIFMLPKRKIRDVRKTRKRFQFQKLIYHNLDNKAREVYVEQNEYEERHNQFMKGNKETIVDEIIREKEEQQQIKDEVKDIKKQCTISYKKLKDQSDLGDKYSQKIVGKLDMKDMCQAIFDVSTFIKNKQTKNIDGNPSFPSIANLVKQNNENNQSPFRFYLTDKNLSYPNQDPLHRQSENK